MEYTNFTQKTAEATHTPIIGCENNMTHNHDGGFSFSTIMAYSTSTDNKQKAHIASSILRQISVFGTSSARIDISAKKLTSDTVDFLNTLVRDGLGSLIVAEFREAYGNSLAPKISTVIYLLAYMTSLSQSIAGTQHLMAKLRGDAYKAVSILRTGSHLLDWVSQHCSMSNKSTGKGFRNAITQWFFAFNKNPTRLALQVTKYFNRNGFTFQDLLRLVHPKTTTSKRCGCRGRAVCKCPQPNPQTFTNLCSLGVQVVIGYLTQGINHALTILVNGIERSEFQGIESSNDITNALNTFAFLAAVTTAKTSDVDNNILVLLIRVFKLPWEVINNRQLHNTEIQESITFGYSNAISQNTYNAVLEQQINMRIIEAKLCEEQKKTLYTTIHQLFPTSGIEAKSSLDVLTQVTKPITALIRQLNQIGHLVNVGNHPRAHLYCQLICEHITNQNVLIRGHVHPLNILNAWATYKTGRGMKGSLTWQVNNHIKTALTVAIEKAFHTVKGLGISIAHLMDRSGSMTWNGSATGMPMLSAHQVVTIMVLCFMRAEQRLSTETKSFVPLQSIGYFGNKTKYNPPSNTLAGAKASSFRDMTNNITHNMTYVQAEQYMTTSCSWGCTDIGAGIYYHIARLEIIIGAIEKKNQTYMNMSPFELFHEAFIVWTDNDVNSGDQPMVVLNIYRILVSRLFHLLPYDKDGKQYDPNALIQKYVPKLVVVATQGTHKTIGDPTDPNVLTVSGFDLSFPTILKTFLSQ
jgi:hypothetical protein